MSSARASRPGGRAPRSAGREATEPGGRSAPSRSVRQLRALAILLVIAGAVTVAVRATDGGRPSGASSVKKAPPVHLSVGIVDCTFVDTTRQTHNYLTGADLPERRLVTEIRYPTTDPTPGDTESPDAKAATSHGPYPLIVFAHGYDLTPDSYAALLDDWVRAGFVVAAPIFPDTSTSGVAAADNIVATEADDVNQPGDVAFVTKHLLAAGSSGTGCRVLHHLIEPGHVALAGQSDGGDTVAALGYESAYVEPSLHFDAVAVLSGSLLWATSPTNHEVAGPPLLVTQSATDQCNLPQSATALYSAIPQSDRWFLALKSGDHLPPYTDSADPSDFALVASVTTQFFKLEAAGHRPGSSFLRLADGPVAVGTLTTGPAPDLAGLDADPASCYSS